MSLQVWLPLTKDLRNQGLASLTSSGTPVFKNSGKLGGKSLDLNTKVNFTCPVMANKTVFSIAFWAKVNADSSLSTDWVDVIGFTDISTSDTSGTLRWETCYSSSNSARGISAHDNATYAITNNPGGNVTSKAVWSHFAFTVGADCRHYINGQLVGISTANGGHLSGAFWCGQTNAIDGEIQDVRIYDHCLSPMEVKQLSQGLILHYPLNRNGWGQENIYGYGSDLQTTLSGLNNYNNGFSIVEEEGKRCAHVSGALTTTKYLQSKLSFTPTTMEQYTFSAEVKIKNIVRGTTNPMCEFYFSGATIDSAWRGFVVEYIHVDGKRVGATAIGFDRFLTNTAWHRVAVTAHFNYSGTSTIPALYPNIYMRDCTGDLYIRNVKLEKGSIATPWCPNSSDTLATTMDLNSTTEYDCSGFCNNGTRTGTFSWTSDTPKYSVSTVFSGSQYITEDNEIETIDSTIAAWVKTSLSANAFILDCRNSNGAGKQPIYQYTNGSIQSGGASQYVATNTGLLVANTWIHLAIVQSGSSLLVYKNGSLFQTLSCTNSPIIKLTVGARYSLSGLLPSGSISDVRIYATALSADDVKSLYQNCATIGSDGTIYGQIRS